MQLGNLKIPYLLHYFALPTQILQDIIIECERDVENGIGIGIASATR